MDGRHAQDRGETSGSGGRSLKLLAELRSSDNVARMSRRWVWLQLIIGWFPVWALYTTLILTAHGTSFAHAGFAGLRAIGAAAVLGLAVHRLARRLPWRQPVRLGFVAIHIGAAAVFAISWMFLTSLMESGIRGRHVIVASPYGIIPFLTLGVWLYVMVAGVAYANQGTERAIRAEAIAARSQLEALRSQLNPHFLFNALHTVVQLIPQDPDRAAHAAEQLAALLRTTLEQDRDLVSLAEEWEFAQRYLEIESLRFGERLRVRSELTDDSRNALLPSFALQTLVENAVRHGAAPRVEPTDISIIARVDNDRLTISVADTGNGSNGDRSNGTGLQRLRDRLSVLYSGRATLDVSSPPGGGYTASLSIPQDED